MYYTVVTVTKKIEIWTVTEKNKEKDLLDFHNFFKNILLYMYVLL